MGYNDEEYRSPRASKQYTSPKNKRKRKTKGQQLEESGEYLQDPETQDTSKPLESKSFEIDPNKKPLTEAQKRQLDKLRRRSGTGQQGADIAKEKLEKRGGSATDLPTFLQSAEMDKVYAEDKEENKEFDEAVSGGTLEDLRKGVKIRNAEIKDYQDPTLLQLISTWSNPQWRKDNIGSHLSGGGDAIYNDPLSLYSDALTTLDKAAGIHDKRRALIDYISDKNEIAGIAAEFIPGAESLAGTGAGIRAIKKASMVYDLDVPRVLGKGYERLRGIGRTIKGAFEGVTGGTGGAKAMSGDGVPQLARMYFSRSGLRGGVFNLDTWRKAGSDRNVMELFQTRWDQVAYRNMPHKQFTSTRKRLIEPFLKEYAPYIKKFNIDPSTIELHHIFGLNLSAPLYDGLRYGSKEWDEMTTLLNKTGLFPGAPATGVAKKSNLMLALEEPHDLLHNQFFKNTIGKKGEKFFTPERMKILHSGPDGRLQVAKEYSEHVKKGEVLIKRAMNQIQAVFGSSNISPDKLTDAFSQSLADGTTNIFKEGYKIESVNKVIKDMVLDIQLDEMVDPLRSRAFKNVSELKQEILLDKAKGLTNKQLKKKYGPKFDIKQLDLFDKK